MPNFANGVASTLTSGSAAAPTAGVSFTATVTPTAGWYEIHGAFVISGAAETHPMNVALIANNVNAVKFPSTAGVGAVVPVHIPRINLDGTHAVSLGAGGSNATAATVYEGWLAITELAD